jgi:hypothetical protein
MASEGHRPFNNIIGEIMKSYFIDFISPTSYQSKSLLTIITTKVNLTILRLEDARKFLYLILKQIFTDGC